MYSAENRGGAGGRFRERRGPGKDGDAGNGYGGKVPTVHGVCLIEPSGKLLRKKSAVSEPRDLVETLE